MVLRVLRCEISENRCIWVLVGGVDGGSVVAIFVAGEGSDLQIVGVPTVRGEGLDAGVLTVILEEGTEEDEGVTLVAAAPAEAHHRSR